MSYDFDFYKPEPPSSGTPLGPGEKPKRGHDHGLSWFETWRLAVLHPGQETAYRIAYDSNASTRLAYIWIFISSLAQLPLILIQIAAMPQTMASVSRQGSNISPAMVSQISTITIVMFILSIVLAVPMFKLGTHITHWAAKQFNGSGSRENYAYLTAAYSAPLQIIAALFQLVVLVLLPSSTSTGALTLIIYLYMLIWQVISLRAAYNQTTGQAIGTMILAVIVSFVLVMVVGCALLMVFAPTFSNWAQSMATSRPR